MELMTVRQKKFLRCKQCKRKATFIANSPICRQCAETLADKTKIRFITYGDMVQFGKRDL